MRVHTHSHTHTGAFMPTRVCTSFSQPQSRLSGFDSCLSGAGSVADKVVHTSYPRPILLLRKRKMRFEPSSLSPALYLSTSDDNRNERKLQKCVRHIMRVLYRACRRCFSSTSSCFFLFVVLPSLHLTPKTYPTARKDKLDDMQFA